MRLYRGDLVELVYEKVMGGRGYQCHLPVELDRLEI
jgi:hypothetical protein